MNDNKCHSELFESIDCLREYSDRIAGYMSDRGPVKRSKSLRKEFLHFVKWREEVERETGEQVLSLPIDPAVLVEYGDSLDERGLAYSTISSYISAVGTMHVAADYPKPTDNPTVRAYLARLREKHSRDDLHRVRALSLVELRDILDKLHIPRSVRPGRMETPQETHKRASVDRAMLLTTVQTGMRQYEAAGFVWGEVREEPDGSGRVLLQSNKQRQRGIWIAISGLCLQTLNDIKPDSADDNSSVFGLTENQVGSRLKRMCKEAGIDPKEVGGNTPRSTLYRLVMEKDGPARMLQQQLRLKEYRILDKYIDNNVDGILEWLNNTFDAVLAELVA